MPKGPTPTQNLAATHRGLHKAVKSTYDTLAFLNATPDGGTDGEFQEILGRVRGLSWPLYKSLVRMLEITTESSPTPGTDVQKQMDFGGDEEEEELGDE